MNAPRTVFQSELISEMSLLVRSCRALVVGLAAIAATLSMTQVAAAAPDKPKVPRKSGCPAVTRFSWSVTRRVTRSIRATTTLYGDRLHPRRGIDRRQRRGHQPLRRADLGGRGRQQSRGQAATIASVTPDPTAIPWLRLRANLPPTTPPACSPTRLSSSGWRPPVAFPLPTRARRVK